MMMFRVVLNRLKLIVVISRLFVVFVIDVSLVLVSYCVVEMLVGVVR